MGNNKYEMIYRYDKNNNLIYTKDSNDIEKWMGYDENNNLIFIKKFFWI
jgi:hypothetical protein